MPCAGCEKDCKCTATKCAANCKCGEPGKCACAAANTPPTAGGCCKQAGGAGEADRCKTAGGCKK